MSMLSYVHQLFNTDNCHAYLHTLRWKVRLLQCPRCQSQDTDPWGNYHYRPGCKRYWCNGCKRTFNDLTNTLMHQSKRSLPHWILATFLLCLACSSWRIAREVGVHVRTSYRWCWWLRNAALSYDSTLAIRLPTAGHGARDRRPREEIARCLPRKQSASNTVHATDADAPRPNSLRRLALSCDTTR
jgi:transposase-like protein